MQRMLKWAAPLVALGLLLGYTAPKAVAADDDKGSVTGMVTGVDGKPAADVTVKLNKAMTKADRKAAKEAAANGEKPKHAKPVATATTDKDGKFEMKDVPAGSYNVVAGVKGESMGHEAVTVTAGSASDVSITLAAIEKKEKKSETK